MIPENGDSDHVRESRVLSIQSHVVSGVCGNKSAVFPLQVSTWLLLFQWHLFHICLLSDARLWSGLYQLGAVQQPHRLRRLDRSSAARGRAAGPLWRSQEERPSPKLHAHSDRIRTIFQLPRGSPLGHQRDQGHQSECNLLLVGSVVYFF